MLTALSIRDVVLIERLDLHFAAGLTTLTGETGAGKSILLDSLGLALGARADGGLIRAGAAQAVVSAVFAVAADHPAIAMLEEIGLDGGGGAEIVLRRILGRDGRSRALVNDQPVSVALLKNLSALLIEVQGQHEQVGLADPANHILLLDAFGVPAGARAAVAAAHQAWKDAAARLKAAEAAIEQAARDEDFLRHAVDELTALAPLPGEEEALAAERQRLQSGERRAEAIAAALGELTPRDRRALGPAAHLRAAARALGKLATPGGGEHPAAEAMAAIERAEEALAEAETLLLRLAQDFDDDPRTLEATEERLFSLRAAARKHGVAVVALPEFLTELRDKLAALETGAADIAALTKETAALRAGFIEAAAALSAQREAAGGRLMKAIAAELPPLKLERARFVVERTMLPEAQWNATGADRIRFLIATNPGEAPGALEKIASGGELSRLMLALKVVLTGGGAVETLIFDEVDSGIGGATAAAVGERLARVAEGVQVLVVTHSPQVAARGATQLRVAKRVARDRAVTLVEVLDEAERREEIARMLAGEFVTDAARDAAASLLAAT